MVAYSIRRIGQALLVLVIVSFIVSSLVRLIPGDPARLVAGEEADEKTVEAIRKDLGLDKPLMIQYVHYLSDIIHGDFGHSYFFGTSVLKELSERFPRTLVLAFSGMLIATIIGGVSGVVAGVKRGTLVDQLSMAVALVGVCLPSFWIGLMLMYLFSLKLRCLPSAGFGTWQHIVLPATTMGIYGAGMIARLIRSSMLDVLNADYIRTARAKGVSERKVIVKHALKNALIPALTIMGLEFGSFMGKSVLVETVFAWPGIARLIVTAITQRDYPVVQGGILWLTATFAIINLVVDLLYGYLDPRIRYQ